MNWLCAEPGRPEPERTIRRLTKQERLALNTPENILTNTQNGRVSLHRQLPIDQLGMDGNFICTYANATQLPVEYADHAISSILKLCRGVGKHRSCMGYKWRFTPTIVDNQDS